MIKTLFFSLLVAKSLAQDISPCANQPDNTLLPDANDPNQFIICYQEQPIYQSCPPGTVWDQSLQYCNWPIIDHDCNGQPDGTLLPNPNNANSYYICSNGMEIEMPCPAGLVWNDIGKYCDYPENVTTPEPTTPEPTTTADPNPTTVYDPSLRKCDPPRKWPQDVDTATYFYGVYYTSIVEKYLGMSVFDAEMQCGWISGELAEPTNADVKYLMEAEQYKAAINAGISDPTGADFYIGVEGEGFTYTTYYYGVAWTLAPNSHKAPFDHPEWWLPNYPNNQSDEEWKNLEHSLDYNVVNVQSAANDASGQSMKNVNGYLHRAKGVVCQYVCP